MAAVAVAVVVLKVATATDRVRVVVVKMALMATVAEDLRRQIEALYGVGSQAIR